MKCVANYEVKTECSIVEDDLVVEVKHPKDLYRARIQNVQRRAFTTPFLLSLHLYFEAPSLEHAQDIMDELLFDCLNMLAFTTGGKFQKHRIRQLVDATPVVDGLRNVFMWAESIQYENPEPFLNHDTSKTLERLLDFDMPPPIKRALRWYRLGINASIPDDQFVNFWFALEIVAEFQKSTEKVPTKCQKCQSPLFCELCQQHPLHKPYAKQAIRELLKAVDNACTDEIIDRLDKTRNGLMHGSTLKEIEDDWPQPHEEIVDILGRLLWRALIHQFPHNMINGDISFGFPRTYLKQNYETVARIQTVVPRKADGDFDLSFTGMTASMTPFGPPQSALPTVISMNHEQFKQLGKFRFTGDQKELFQRLFDRSQEHKEKIYVQVLSTDLAFITKQLNQNIDGEWQTLLREILKNSKV